MGAFDAEIAEESRNCDQHGAYISRKIEGFGLRPRWSACPECRRIREAEIDAERAAKAAADEANRIDALLTKTGIPYRFRSRDLANYVPKTDGAKAALMAANEFVDNFKSHYDCGDSMIFSGMPGTGKSHLSVGIAQALAFRNWNVRYVNALEAIREVRGTWRRDSEKTEQSVLDYFGAVALLVIDEVGMQYGTEGEQVILFDIINRRYEDQLPTIIATNQGKDGLKAYLGDRTFDRLREGGKWVAFDWQSYRGQS